MSSGTGPAEELHRAISAGGKPLALKASALLRLLELGERSPRSIEQATRLLDAAGVELDRPLAQTGDEDRVTLRVASPPSPGTEDRAPQDRSGAPGASPVRSAAVAAEGQPAAEDGPVAEVGPPGAPDRQATELEQMRAALAGDRAQLQELEQLRSELVAGQAQLQERNQELEQLRSAVVADHGQLEEHDQELEQARVALVAAQAELEERSAELSQADARAAAVGRELVSLRASSEREISELRGALSSDRGELQRRLAAAEARAQGAEQTVVRLRAAFDESGARALARSEAAYDPPSASQEGERLGFSRKGRSLRREARSKAEDTPRAEDTPQPSRQHAGLFGRWRARAFRDEPGYCAVCNRELQVDDDAQLEVSGWVFSGDSGVCPSCQEDGWQLPEGAAIPFRRTIGREPS